MDKYYDGTKLLSMKDINGETPSIYLCTTNRTGGKTTYFSRLLTNKFKKQNKKFAILYRFNYELDECADKFFKDINGLFFKDDVMTSKRRAAGIFHELYLNDISCGYAISINSADQIKKYSHLLSDTEAIMFDEFQSETNHYCNDEVKKLMSVYTSIARGQGEQMRNIPLYMIGNPVSLINPYYVELGISTRLVAETKFLRGDGFVLEQGYVESAAIAQKQSGFMRAFSKNDYSNYASQGVYLNDNLAFVEHPDGRSRYIATIKFGNHNFGIREYPDDGIIYCDDKADLSFPFKIAVTTDEHQINYVMLKRNDLFITNLRWYFERGCFRFKNLKCKEALLKAISY